MESVDAADESLTNESAVAEDEEQQIVTPWEVASKEGGINYDRLVTEFGVTRLTQVQGMAMWGVCVGKHKMDVDFDDGDLLRFLLYVYKGNSINNSSIR